jgi:hypothetical protein
VGKEIENSSRKRAIAARCEGKKAAEVGIFFLRVFA